MNYLIIILSVLFLVSCSQNPFILTNNFESSMDPIYGGSQVFGDSWNSVVALSAEMKGSHKQFCSGVLISKSLVLTAAHCVKIEKLEPFNKNVKVYVGPGEFGGKYGGQYSIKDSRIHPIYNENDTTQDDKYDFALLELTTEIDIPNLDIIEPLSKPEEINELLKVGEKVVIVGYGRTENRGHGLKYEVSTTITKINGEELLIGGDGRDSCHGDSGGPVFAKLENGSFRILGITSRGGVCGSGGIYGKVPSAIEWIAREIGRID